MLVAGVQGVRRVVRVVVSNVVGGRPSNRNGFSRCRVREFDDVGIIVNKYYKMYDCMVGSVRLSSTGLIQLIPINL